jgi:serine/threonine-protein kinase
VQALLFVHAALVPAPAIRTAILHTVACLPLFFIARGRAIELDGDTWAWLGVYSVLGWALVLAAVSAVLSHLLYRLEVRVRAAVRLGQYQLEERLGEGAMGIVYKASHGMLKRPTAIKVLPPDLAGELAVARFEREVRLTSRLSHPNTVAIYDFGRTPEGVFYYAMELLDGLNQARIVEISGRFDAARTVHVLQQCAGALAEAHALDLVHRDVKPENILLCRRGGVPDTVKVVDFGLVKDLEAPKDAQLSRHETLLGTPLYMPPESITAESAIDGRADLYSLGAVAYFLLTGHPPFEGKTVVEVCAHHLKTVPTLPSERIGRPIASDLEAIVMRLLEKKPEHRFASALELEEALLDCADSDGWRRSEAEAWWTEHHDEVERMRKGEPLPRGRALTIAVSDS